MQPETIDYSSMSKEERVSLTENLVIESPQFRQAIKKMAECHQRSKYTSEPRCLLITGGTGFGKTTIARYYCRNYPRVVTDEGTIIPVLRSSVSSPATIKGMASWFLKDLGDPRPDSGTTQSLTMRLCKLIKGCGVELIILDEFQHLIDKDTQKVLNSSADWLKHIMNETGVPIILLGMPWSVKILSANDQLQRRFAARIDLKPFGWSTTGQQKEFEKFLIVLERALPLPKPSNLYDGEMPLRLFCATRGVISNMKKLISKAAEKAFDKGFDSINNDLLALAYDEELALGAPVGVNPFRVGAANLDIVEPSKQARLEEGGGRRGWRNAHGRPKARIADILRK